MKSLLSLILLAMILLVARCFAQAPDYCRSLTETPDYATVTNPNPTDGPAALPLRCVATKIADMPSFGGTVSVAPGGSLQAAYNSALCGTTIKLAHGNTWVGPYTFAAKGCDRSHWITIRSDGTLPVPGARLTPAALAQLATITVKGAQTIAVSGDHIHFVGIEITQPVGSGVNYGLIDTSGADHVVFDRVYCHGNAGQESDRCIHARSGKYVAVISSWLSEIHCIAVTGACTEGVGFGGGSGAPGELISQSGPFKLWNNHIESSTENAIFGGGIADGCPRDITVQNNHFYKPIAWNPSDPTFAGTKYVVKNNFELKNACRVLIEGNVFENDWGGYSQQGYAVLLTPKNQAGGPGINLCPACTVTDVTFRYNHVTTASGAFMISSGPSDNGGWSQGNHRASIHDNVADNLQYPACYGCGHSLVELGSGYSASNPPPATSVLSDVSFQHNDLIAVGDLAPAGVTSQLLNMGGPPVNTIGVPQLTNVAFQGNIASTLKSGMFSTGGGVTNCMYFAKPQKPFVYWPTCTVGASPFAGNLLVGYAGPQTDWPTGQVFAPNFAGVFTNYAAGDYHVPAGPYSGMGANVDMVTQYTAGAK